MARKNNQTTLAIELVHRADGSAVLKCVRADGTSTWQVQKGAYASFFPLHDLTHFAVETSLEVRSGFFGLIAAGWDIEETTGKGKRGELPAEAKMVEFIVGSLDSQRGSGTRWTAEEFTAHILQYAEQNALPAIKITPEQLDGIWQKMHSLFNTWRELPPNGSLRLRFPE